MISIVVIYNSENILNTFLLPSLLRQTVNYEYIPIDNTKKQFKSAAEALNYGGRKAVGKYIMFVHQDVDLCADTWLEKAEMILESIPNLGVAGVAGKSDKGRSLKDRCRNIIIDHEHHRVWGNPIEKPEIVQTLDECLIIVPKHVFNLLKFDDAVCDNWHLYAVDYCLSCREYGHDVYVIPLQIYHRSTSPWHNASKIKILISLGPLPGEYYRTLRRVIEKHKVHYRYVYTTNGEWNTFQPVIIQRVLLLINRGFDIVVKSITGFISK